GAATSRLAPGSSLWRSGPRLASAQAGRNADSGGMATDLSRVMSLEVPLIVVLGERQMRLSDVVGLIPGAIIELPKNAEEELVLLVNNKRIATGAAVKVGENFGLRITYVG